MIRMKDKKAPLTANLSRETMFMFETALQRKAHKRRDWFISIHADGYEPIRTPIIQNTHYASFWDSLPGDVGTDEQPFLFSKTQAADMAEFIRMVRSKNGNLWVNCHAGISRSGAIVELLTRLGWRDLDADVQMTRYPNPWVYLRLREHFPHVSLPTVDPRDPFWTPRDYVALEKVLREEIVV